MFLTTEENLFEKVIRYQVDLPLIAIHDKKYTYRFSKTEDIEIPGRLPQFVTDYYLGRLRKSEFQTLNNSDIDEVSSSDSDISIFD